MFWAARHDSIKKEKPMFEYEPIIRQLYSSLDQLLRSEGLDKALSAAEIASNVALLKQGMDKTAEKIQKLEQQIGKLEKIPQLADES